MEGYRHLDPNAHNSVIKVEADWDFVTLEMQLDQYTPSLKLLTSREDSVHFQAYVDRSQTKGVELERALNEIAMLDMRLTRSEADSKYSQSEVIRLETELANSVPRDLYTALQDSFRTLEKNSVPKHMLDNVLQELEARNIEVDAMKARLPNFVSKDNFDAANREIARLQAVVDNMIPREEHDALKQENVQTREALWASNLQISEMVPKQEFDSAIGEVTRLEHQLLIVTQDAARLKTQLDESVPKIMYNRAVSEGERQQGRADVLEKEKDRLEEMVANMVPRLDFEAAVKESSRLRQEHAELHTHQMAELATLAPRADLERALEETSRLRGRLAAAEEEASRTKAQLRNCVSKRDYDDAVEEAAALRDRATSLAKQAEQLQMSIGTMVPRADLDSALAIQSQLEGRIKHEMDRMATMVPASELQRCKLEIVRLQDTVKDMVPASEHEALKQTHAKTQSALQALPPKQVFDDAQRRVIECEREIEELKRQRSEMVPKAELERVSSEYRERMAAMVPASELQRCKQEIARLEDSMKDMVPSTEHEALQQAHVQTRIVLQTLPPKQALDDAQRRVTECELEIEALKQQRFQMVPRTELDRVASEYSQRMAAMVPASELLNSKQEIARLDETVKNMVSSTEHETLQQAYAKARTALQALPPKQMFDDAQRRLIECEREIEDLKWQRSEMVPKAELERVASEYGERMAAMVPVSELHHCKREIDRLEDALNNMVPVSEHEALKQSHAHAQNALQTLPPKQAFDNAQSRVIECEREIEDLKRQRSEMVPKAELERFATYYRERMATMVPASELLHCKQELEALQHAHENVQGALQALPPKQALDDAQRRVIECEREIEELKQQRSEMVPRTELDRVASEYKEQMATLVPASELLNSKQEIARLEQTVKNMIPSTEHEALQQAYTRTRTALQALPPKQTFDDAQRRVIECEREIEDLKRQRSEMVPKAELERVSSEYRERIAAMVPASELQHCKQELATLQQAHANASNSLQALPPKQAFDDAQRRITECEREIEELKRQRSEMVPKAELECVANEYRERMAAMVPASELQHCKQELATLQQAHFNASNSLQALPSKQVFDDAQRRVIECEREIEDLKRQRSEMVPKAELERVASEYGERMVAMVPASELHHCKQELATLQQTHASSEREIEELKQQWSEMVPRSELERVTNEYIHLERELVSTSMEVTHSREQLTESSSILQHQLSLERERAAKTSAELQQNKESMTRLQSDLGQALSEVDRLERTLDSTVSREALDQVQRKLEETTRRADAQAAQMSGLVQRSELEAARKEIARLTDISKIKTATMVPKTDFDTVVDEVSQLRKINAEMHKQSEMLRTEVNTRVPSETLNAAQERVRELEKLCREQTTSLAAMAPRAELEYALEETSRLRGRLAAAEEETSRTQTQLGGSVSRKDYDDAVGEAAALRDHAASLAVQQDRLRADLEQAQRETERLRATTVPREEMERLQRKLEDLTGRANSQSAQLSDMIHRSELDAARREIGMLEGRLTAASQEAARTQAQLDGSVSKMAHERLLIEAAELRDKAAASSAELERLRSVISSSSSMPAQTRSPPSMRSNSTPQAESSRPQGVQAYAVNAYQQDLGVSDVDLPPPPPPPPPRTQAQMVAEYAQMVPSVPAAPSPPRKAHATVIAPTAPAPTPIAVASPKVADRIEGARSPQKHAPVLSPGFMPGAGPDLPQRLETPVQSPAQSPVLKPSKSQLPPHMWV
jgi:ketosteroid isomerase-like protein